MLRDRQWLSVLLSVIVMVLPISLRAQQLTTFIDGQPALASQVNGNFNALLSEITTLKTQVATLQTQTANLQTQSTTLQGQVATLQSQVATLQGKPATVSIVGTWDMYSIDSTYFVNTSTGTSSSADIHSSSSGGTIVFRSDGTYTAIDSSNGAMMVISRSVPPTGNTLQIGISSSSGSNSESGTYKVTGNTVTTTASDGSTGAAVFSADGSVFINRSVDGSRSTLSVGIKRQ